MHVLYCNTGVALAIANRTVIGTIQEHTMQHAACMKLANGVMCSTLVNTILLNL